MVYVVEDVVYLEKVTLGVGVGLEATTGTDTYLYAQGRGMPWV